MISACVFYLALSWAMPAGGCDVPVQFAERPPTGAYFMGNADPSAILAYASAEGVTLLPAAAPYLHHILAHEITHYWRIKAGTVDYTRPYEEERIAIEAACEAAPIPGCEGSDQ